VSDVLKSVDQSELLRLKHEQITTIDQIMQHDGSMKEKIIKLAQIMEQRINLLDPELTFAVNQISTEIKRVLSGQPVANFLHQYLPDKYKDPRLAGYAKLQEYIEQYSGVVELRQPIEHCSNDDLYRLFGANEDYDNILDTEVKRTTNRKDIILEEMFKRGMKLDGYKLRNPISAHDFHYEIPETLEGLNAGLLENIAGIIKRWGGKPTVPHTGILARVEEWPPTNYDDSKKYYLATKIYEQILGSEDLKMSGSWDRWCRRGYTEIVEGKHGAGNSDKLPTILCSWCSRNVDEDPTDYQLMFPDQESKTGWRCIKCKGENTLTRYTTREQVGDRKDVVQAFASNVMNHLPDLGDFYLDYISKYLERIENSRKRVIAAQFSDSAIGGTSTKVIKSKAK
jgi:hypothetical protein